MIARSLNPMMRWHESWRLLAVLVGSDHGATDWSLASQGFLTVTLDLLVADGFAQAMPRKFTCGAHTITYAATDAGRSALAKRQAVLAQRNAS